MEVLEILDSRGWPYIRKTDEEYTIQCPNASAHKNGDMIASFSINVEKLVGHCFVCNLSMNEAKLTRWLLGGELEDLSLETMALRARLKRITANNDPELSEARKIMLPPGDLWEQDYRNISAKTYQQLEAIDCKQGWYSDRICFPIYLNNELVGIDARSLKDDMQPKYLRNKGCSCKTDWLYPYDLIKNNRPEYVVLCEGIFDSINLFDKLGPVGLCIFGTNNFSLTKLRMVLATGCKEVVLFFDPDEAGRSAEVEIGSIISDWLPVSVANSGLGTLSKHAESYKDCGEMTAEELREALENRTKFKL